MHEMPSSRSRKSSSANSQAPSLPLSKTIEDLTSLSLHDDHISVRGETALWRAVLTQALMDAGSNSHKQEMQRARRQAIEWLLTSEEDFVTVCLYAGLNPAYVRVKAKEAMLNGCKWRNDPVKRSVEMETKSLQFAAA